MEWDTVADTLDLGGAAWKSSGGRWAAAVKSAKTHLRRVMGTRQLTHEEFNTFAVQVEMYMSSRPLTAATGDPEDLQVPSPGHFLSRRAFARHPEACQTDSRFDTPAHWRLITAMREHCWTLWTRECLHTLQQRTKWTQTRPHIAEGEIVLTRHLLRTEETQSLTAGGDRT